MAASDMRALAVTALLVVIAGQAAAQSAGDMERCFRDPRACAGGGAAPAPAPPPGTGGVAAAPAARAPDHTSVLQAPEAERRKLQESLKALDKYAGPIDGNLQSDASTKGIADWQKGKGLPPTGKLTPEEARALNADAANAPIKRIEPAPAPAPAVSTAAANLDALKAAEAKRAERRKVAEPKAQAALDLLLADMKKYAASDGADGPLAGEFKDLKALYAATGLGRSSTLRVSGTTEDYGASKSGVAHVVELRLAADPDAKKPAHCIVLAWNSAAAAGRKDGAAVPCGDVAGLETWKTSQGLRSDWR